MKKLVGIRFKTAGKVYDFDCGAFVLKRGDHVIVETEQGLGFGTVVVPPSPYEESASDKPHKKVFRLATEKDFKQRQQNLSDENSAHTYCL
ncbi:MAG: stage 0 sporulation protein, partial [Desulfobacterales bacterium]